MNNIKPNEIPWRSFPVDVTSSMPAQVRGSSAETQRVHPVRQSDPPPAVPAKGREKRPVHP